MKMPKLSLPLLLLGAGAVFLYMRTRRPDPRWQPGSIFYANDPETGYTRYEVRAVEWREKQRFDVDRTEYPAGWWYQVNAGWYPQGFLETKVR